MVAATTKVYGSYFPFSFSRPPLWKKESNDREGRCASAPTYTMSLSHSAQMFCPGGRLDCGVDGCCCLVSGAETGLSPVRAGEDGVITPLCAVGSAISQRSYRTGMHQANWSQLIQSKNHWRERERERERLRERVTLLLRKRFVPRFALDYR